MQFTKGEAFSRPLHLILLFLLLTLIKPPTALSQKCLNIPLKSLNFNNLSFASPSLRLLDVSIKTSILRDGKCTKALNVKNIRIGILKVKLKNKWIILKNVNVHGDIFFSPEREIKSFFLVSIPGSGNIELQAHGSLKRNINILVHAENLNLFPLVQQFVSVNLTRGNIPISLEMNAILNPESRKIRSFMHVKIKHGRWEDEAFEYAGDKVDMDFSFSVITKEDNPSIFEGKGIANVNHGDIIFKNSILNFREVPLTAKFFIKADSSSSTIFIDPAVIKLGNVARFFVHGALHEKLYFEVESEKLQQLAGLFAPELKKTFNIRGFFRSSGVLKRFNKRNNVLIAGKAIADIHLESNNSFKIHSSARLPFVFSRDEGKLLQGKVGQIKIEYLHLKPLKIGPTTIKLQTISNGWELERKVKILSNKGIIFIDSGNLKVFPELRGYLVVSTPKCIENNFNWSFLSFPLKTKICFSSYRIKLAKSNLISDGILKVLLLSGSLEVFDFRVENIFSNDRNILLSAKWHDIDLRKLSQITSFGLITGKLKGSVTNLRLAYGAPVAFDLIIESQPASNQIISIAAIENITEIGSATSPFKTLAGKLIATLFKKFPYDKIGMRCILKNDLFSLKGLIKKGNIEYLVKRKGLRGVNIINKHSPNLISWQEMIRRLQRIKRVETSGKGGKTSD